MKNAWIRVASTDATPNKWTQISGMLVMPENSEQLVGELQNAILYFGGPSPEINFMVANVELASEEEDDETGIISLPTTKLYCQGLDWVYQVCWVQKL
jgi:hypothetical protein